MGLSLGILIWTIKAKPYSDRKVLKIEIINEIALLILLLLLGSTEIYEIFFMFFSPTTTNTILNYGSW